MLVYMAPTRVRMSDFQKAQTRLVLHLVKEKERPQFKDAPEFKQGAVLGRSPIDLTTAEAKVLNVAQALLLWPYMEAYDPSNHQEIPRFLANMRTDMQAARARIEEFPLRKAARLIHLWNVATTETHISKINTQVGKVEDKRKREAAIMLAFELVFIMRY